MADKSLSETQEMVAAQQVEIRHLSEGQARIETEVKEMRAENTEQHRENGRALAAIYKLLWGVLVSGFVLACALAGYLINTDGGPYVSKAQYTSDIDKLLCAIRSEK